MAAGEKAEAYAARMIEQGRLQRRIDQIDGVTFFWQHDRYGETYSAVGLGVRLAVDVERVAVSHTVRYQIYILWQDIASS